MNRIVLEAFNFETERLRLRPLRVEDGAFFSDLYAEPDTMKFIGPPLSMMESRSVFQTTLSRMRGTSLRGFSLVMIEKSSLKPFGICGTSKFEVEASRIEVGILLQSERRSQGFGKEALQDLLGKIFSHLPVDEIRVRFSIENRIVEQMNISLGFAPCVDGIEKEDDLSIRNWKVHRASWYLDQIFNSNQRPKENVCLM